MQQQGQIQHSKESQDPPPLPNTDHPKPPRNRRERRDLWFQRGRFSTPEADQHPHDSENDDDFQPPLTSSSSKPLLLKAEDVGFFDPDFQPEQEHGNTTPGPVVNASKHVYYLDVFMFVNRLKELARKHCPVKVIHLMPSCLQGQALICWAVEVDDLTKELKRFRTMPIEALSELYSSTYTL